MRPSRQLVDLLARYADLATRDRKLLSEDQRLSLRFYRAELAALEDSAGDSRSDRVSVWISNVTAVAEFVSANDHLPRVNRRRPDVEIDPETRRLEQWLNHETRRAQPVWRCLASALQPLSTRRNRRPRASHTNNHPAHGLLQHAEKRGFRVLPRRRDFT